MMAGLDGVENKIHPGEAATKDLYHLPPEEDAKIPTVCHSLDQALDYLDKDPRLPDQGWCVHRRLHRRLHRAEDARGHAFPHGCASGRVRHVLRAVMAAGRHPCCSTKDGRSARPFLLPDVVRQSPDADPSALAISAPCCWLRRRTPWGVYRCPWPLRATRTASTRRRRDKGCRTDRGHAHHRGAGAAPSVRRAGDPNAKPPGDARIDANQQRSVMPSAAVCWRPNSVRPREAGCPCRVQQRRARTPGR